MWIYTEIALSLETAQRNHRRLDFLFLTVVAPTNTARPNSNNNNGSPVVDDWVGVEKCSCAVAGSDFDLANAVEVWAGRAGPEP